MTVAKLVDDVFLTFAFVLGTVAQFSLFLKKPNKKRCDYSITPFFDAQSSIKYSKVDRITPVAI